MVRTELPRRFFHGFILTKKDVEEIHDVLVQRMEGAGAQKKQYIATYELRFKYGAIQERLSIHDVLKEANGGELTIKGLKITLEDKNAPKDQSISLQFSDIRGLPNPMSIYYNIIGTDEGWVNDTDTQLAIKIKGIKTLSLDELNQRFNYGWFIMFLLMLLTVLNLIAYMPISPYFGLLFMAVVLLVLVLLLVLLRVGRYFFPSYNFCWGTYEQTFKRRRAIGVWLIVGVLLSIALSVFANFLSVKIGIH